MDIVEKLQTANQTAWGRGRIQFAHHWNQIHRALESGYSRRAIWNLLHQEGAIDVGYHQFNAYVSQFRAKPDTLQEGRDEEQHQAPQPMPVQTTEPAADTPQRRAVRPTGKTFTFNPRPNRSELI